MSTTPHKQYAQVALDVPIFTPLTYRVPPELAPHLQEGQLVQVPFRNQSKTGLLMALTDELDDPKLEKKLKSIVDIVDLTPLLSPTDLRFLRFIADYYFSSIGDVVRLAIPSAARLDGMKHYQLQKELPPAEILSEELRPVLDILKTDEPRSIKSLRDHFSALTYHRLAELEEKGFVTVSFEEEEKFKPKTETYYRLIRSPQENERLGKNQLHILERLQKTPNEPVALAEIRKFISSPYSSLNSLIKRGLIDSFEEEIYRDPFADAPITKPPQVQLTAPQQKAVQAVADARQKGDFRGFVLHGVTGSGKTQVYVQIIRQALSEGLQAIILLPEIALTPQFVGVFRGYFGDQIAVLHSGLTPAQKFDQWRRIKNNEVDIVIGARSAIFAPLSNLGVIVVDEEHDSSFKQEQGTRYNARDMALVRGQLTKSQVILGSATPILESFHNAQQERLTYLAMPDRVAQRPLPNVEIIDMRKDEESRSERSPILSKQLLQAVDATLHAEKQGILFLNRRGYSPCVLCEACGHIFKCPNCAVSLTYHQRMEALRCHHCDFSLRTPEICPECREDRIDRKGIGTEQLEIHLKELYPRARIARLDRDTSSGNALRRTLQRFRNREIDLLVGTQMVTKGHDFPHVTLVGVVLADMSLNFPDFRAAERTFQLLTQVAGRAGRAHSPGQVYIQTYTPDHYSLLTAQDHDYQTFAKRELLARKTHGYPPFTHLIATKFEGISEMDTINAARQYATVARQLFRHHDEFGSQIAMLGPAMAPIARINNRSRWQIIFKSPNRAALRAFTARLLNLTSYFSPTPPKHLRNIRIIVDVDPQSLL